VYSDSDAVGVARLPGKCVLAKEWQANLWLGIICSTVISDSSGTLTNLRSAAIMSAWLTTRSCSGSGSTGALSPSGSSSSMLPALSFFGSRVTTPFMPSSSTVLRSKGCSSCRTRTARSLLSPPPFTCQCTPRHTIPYHTMLAALLVKA
jgi:hypothetical protein